MKHIQCPFLIDGLLTIVTSSLLAKQLTDMAEATQPERLCRGGDWTPYEANGMMKEIAFPDVLYVFDEDHPHPADALIGDDVVRGPPTVYKYQ